MSTKIFQAFTEFLMTYGWIILVMLVFIGVLAYFGVFTPSNYQYFGEFTSSNYQEPDYIFEKENCWNEGNFRFVYSIDRLEERNLTIEDLHYVTYITRGYYKHDIKCRTDISDCWVYREEEICETEIIDKIEINLNTTYIEYGLNYILKNNPSKEWIAVWLEVNCECIEFDKIVSENSKDYERIEVSKEVWEKYKDYKIGDIFDNHPLVGWNYDETRDVYKLVINKKSVCQRYECESEENKYFMKVR